MDLTTHNKWILNWNRLCPQTELLTHALNSLQFGERSYVAAGAALILHYAKWLWNPRMDESRSHGARWEKISWARRHGHRAVSVVMATEPSASSPASPLRGESPGGRGGVRDGGLTVRRCTLVSMNKRRAGRDINNEHGELKLEAVKSERVCACVFNLLNSEAARQTSGEHGLYFSLESTLVLKEAVWKNERAWKPEHKRNSQWWKEHLLKYNPLSATRQTVPEK